MKIDINENNDLEISELYERAILNCSDCKIALVMRDGGIERHAGTVEKTVRELKKLNREHPSHWEHQKEVVGGELK